MQKKCTKSTTNFGKYQEGGECLKSNSILLTRIDNRLIHGQIVGEWASTVGANLLVVADDKVVLDETEKSLMTIAAGSLGYSVRFFSIEQTIEVIGNASPDQKILLLCRTPNDVRRLIEGNVQIDEVNIGNMHPSPGKNAIAKNVYVDEKDLDDLNYIKSKVENIYTQDVPKTKKENF